MRLMNRNSVLEELRVRKWQTFRRRLLVENVASERCAYRDQRNRKRKRVVCHQHRGDGVGITMK